MKQRLSALSKETRCYIMSAIMVFEGFNGVDAMTETQGEMSLDVLGLSKEDIMSFPMPEYSQIISHLKIINDPEVRHFILSNTYLPVLRSQKADAYRAFKQFCSDLKWSSSEVKESMELTEQISDIKPLYNITGSSKSGCLTVIVFAILSSTLLAFTVI